MKRFRIGLVIGLVGVALWQAAGPAAAQSYSSGYVPSAYRYPPRNFSGLVSGYEAWQLNDIRRRAELARQVDLLGDMYWRWSGVSSYYPGVFEAWPMVPGNIWGWPAAISPPVVSSTRVAPQFDPELAQPPAAAAPAAASPPAASAPQSREGLPTPPPNFSPGPELSPPAEPAPPAKRRQPPAGKEPSTRRLTAGPRQF
jgi:hypothetical protein